MKKVLVLSFRKLRKLIHRHYMRDTCCLESKILLSNPGAFGILEQVSIKRLFAMDCSLPTSGKELACQCRRCKRCGFQSLGWEDLLEEDMATHSSVLAWSIPWIEEPGGLQSMESQRIRRGWNNLAHMQETKRKGKKREIYTLWVISMNRLLC